MFILVHLGSERDAVIQTDAIIAVKDQANGATVHLNTKDGVAVVNIRERAREVFAILATRHVNADQQARSK